MLISFTTSFVVQPYLEVVDRRPVVFAIAATFPLVWRML